MFLISMHLKGISIGYEKRSRVDLIWERASSLKLQKKKKKSQSDQVFPKMEILKLNEKYMFVFLTVPSAPKHRHHHPSTYDFTSLPLILTT